jgi:hypothetical protein
MRTQRGPDLPLALTALRLRAYPCLNSLLWALQELSATPQGAAIHTPRALFRSLYVFVLDDAGSSPAASPETSNQHLILAGQPNPLPINRTPNRPLPCIATTGFESTLEKATGSAQPCMRGNRPASAGGQYELTPKAARTATNSRTSTTVQGRCNPDSAPKGNHSLRCRLTRLHDPRGSNATTISLVVIALRPRCAPSSPPPVGFTGTEHSPRRRAPP